MYKVLFHTDENSKLQLTLRNINNLISELGQENLSIEVVLNSEAISLMYKSNNTYREEVKDLYNKKISFSVCGNAMKAYGITKDMLLKEAKIVPSGIVQIVKKQGEGYLYIKP